MKSPWKNKTLPSPQQFDSAAHSSHEHKLSDHQWDHIKQSMYLATGFAFHPQSNIIQRQWISRGAEAKMPAPQMQVSEWRTPTSTAPSDDKPQERPWKLVVKVAKMEVAFASGSSTRLFGPFYLVEITEKANFYNYTAFRVLASSVIYCFVLISQLPAHLVYSFFSKQRVTVWTAVVSGISPAA